MNNFATIIASFCSSPTNENMEKVCHIIKNSPFDKTKIAELTRKLALSGDTLDFSKYNTSDIPSTGGPSSLSTVIGPLILKDFFAIAKLGIIGRPAGGIDILAQIEGYNLRLSKKEIYRIIDKTQYCHFISNDQFAPLDNKLFIYRNKNNYKDVSGLVIASLLSKKVAVNIKNLCLDIRYSYFGNFGKSLKEAKMLSDNFKQVADLLGIHCTFYFSDNSRLFQPFIGRGESLLAVHNYFKNNKNYWLDNHIEVDCKNMVESLVGNKILTKDLRKTIYKNFEENIVCQGGNMKSFEEIAEKTRILHIHEFIAYKTGILNIDIMKMREAIVDIQNKYVSAIDEFPDPCGLIFLKNQNDYISKKEIILTFRVLDGDLEYFKNKINSFISIN